MCVVNEMIIAQIKKKKKINVRCIIEKYLRNFQLI